MASLRQAKKEAKKQGLTFVDPTKDRRKLENSVKQQLQETNKRLRALDRKGYYNSFSSKKLFDRLGGKINALEKTDGKVTAVKMNKKMNMTDLTAIQKATKQFLNSATSSPFKIKRVVSETKESMFKTLKIKDDSLTMDDIETYYNMLGDKDFDYFNEKLGASEMWGLIDDAIDGDMKKNEFLNMLNRYIDVNDRDVRKKAISLFDKYVTGG